MPEWWPNLDFDTWWTAVEFIYIGVFFLLKASLLKKKTSFGWSMAVNNYATGVVFLVSGIFLFWRPSLLTVINIRHAVLLAVGITITWATFELVKPPPPHAYEMRRLEGTRDKVVHVKGDGGTDL